MQTDVFYYPLYKNNKLCGALVPLGRELAASAKAIEKASQHTIRSGSLSKLHLILLPPLHIDELPRDALFRLEIAIKKAYSHPIETMAQKGLPLPNVKPKAYVPSMKAWVASKTGLSLSGRKHKIIINHLKSPAKTPLRSAIFNAYFWDTLMVVAGAVLMMSTPTSWASVGLFCGAAFVKLAEKMVSLERRRNFVADIVERYLSGLYPSGPESPQQLRVGFYALCCVVVYGLAALGIAQALMGTFAAASKAWFEWAAIGYAGVYFMHQLGSTFGVVGRFAQDRLGLPMPFYEIVPYSYNEKMTLSNKLMDHQDRKITDPVTEELEGKRLHFATIRQRLTHRSSVESKKALSDGPYATKTKRVH